MHGYGAFAQSEEKTKEEDLQREKSAHKWADLEKKVRDKRPAEEISSVDESEPSYSKERKSTSFGIDAGTFNDEGTRANSNFRLHDTVTFVAHTYSLLLLWFK